MTETERLERIRLVTRRYDELQGLTRCSFGLGCIVAAAVSVATPAGSLNFVVAALAGLSVLVPSARIARQYYSERFGRVAHETDESKWRGWVIGGAAGMSAIVEQNIGPRYPQPFFVAIALFLAWSLVRDWPWRKYLIVDVCAAVFASALYVGVAPAEKEPYWWMCVALMGSAALITGMCDHRLLVRTLTATRSPQEQPHADAV